MIKNIIIYGGFSGITVFIGGLVAKYFNHHMKNSPIKTEISHTLMSFGSGVMLSALALVLVPKGIKSLDLIPLTLSFIFGTVIFMNVDRYLAKKGGQTATLLAMMMDFVPESIALGAVFAIEPKMATLLAVFIGMQNLPEAFNAYRDIVLSGFSPKKTLVIFFFLSFCGIAGALLGHFVLSNHQDITAYLMTISSGGILYLLIQDIIPESKMNKSYLTSIGATIGFLVGIIGNKLI
ncbi:MAG: divalent cation transporter [Clostridiales bacterium]|nr:MAG: divalent cation transporter [Clostridiales bacterium]